MVGPRLLHASDPRRFLATPTEIFADDLALEALNAAKAAGAQYADARVGNYRRQTLNTREHQITGVTDSESYGIGVRTLVDGAWERASVPFRYAWPAEFDLMAQLAGLSLRERWSDWRREPFTSESAKHVSVWARDA